MFFLELCNEDSLISIDTKDFGKVILAVIKGKSLRTIYKNQERKGQLFKKNVRRYIKRNYVKWSATNLISQIIQ